MNQKKLEVLLVDDDSRILKSLSRDLVDAGFEVTCATCAVEAGVVVNACPIDVIVCDYQMPGKSGLQFLEEISESHPDLVRILLSGVVADLGVAQKWADEIGIHKILAKPCRSEIIIEAIVECSEELGRECPAIQE